MALLVGHLAVGGDDGVADGALGLAFERADDVAAEGCQAVDDAAVLFCLEFRLVTGSEGGQKGE